MRKWRIKLSRRLHHHFVSILAISLLIIAFQGCSSLPETLKNPPPPDIATGNDYLRRGEYAMRKGDFQSAAAQFARSYESFTLADYIKGKIRASLALSRAYHRLDTLILRDYWLDRGLTIIDTFSPESINEWKLAKTEIEFQNSNFDSVLVYTDGVEIGSDLIETNSQLISYRLMAKLQYPNPSSESVKSEYDELKSGFKKLIALKEDAEIGDALVIGFVGYVLGYTDSKLGRWIEAYSWFEKARDEDSRRANYRGLADNLFGLGAAAQSLNKPKDAEGFYERSSEIYYSIGLQELGARAESKALNIRVKAVSLNLKEREIIKERLTGMLSFIKSVEIRSEIEKTLGAISTMSTN
ncbi:MAG: tetratricopeptide repeat protein [Chloroherpetonaceae bacterium]|nr:tetratricopeptide repeat protein [Chloroherpetonaceae bacterium]